MGRRSNDVGVWYWRRMNASGNEPGEVRHVDQVERANFVSNLSHAHEINDSRIGAAAANDQLRAFPLGQLFQVVVVNRFRLFGYSVRNNVISLAGKIQVMSVSEVPAVRQV